MNKLSGIIPPLVTPVHSDGRLDVESLQKLIDNCINEGVNGIFIMGSCGEGSVLGAELRADITREAVKIVAGRVALLVGVLESSTQKVIEEIKRLEPLGAEYFVVTPPFYLPAANQDQIYAHFKDIAASTKKNIVAYNIPCFVNSEILPETQQKICAIENVVGVKDSTGNWDLFQKALMLKKQNDFTLISGDESLASAGMIFGSNGCVPCLGNPYPRMLVDLYEAAQRKDIDGVFALETKLVQTKRTWGCGGYWIAIVKYLCARKGLCQPYTLTPSLDLTDEQKRFIDELLDVEEVAY